MLAPGDEASKVAITAALSVVVLLTWAGAAPAQDDYELLWHRYLPDPIYTTTGVSEPGKTVLAGNYLNPPKEAEAIPVLGDGTPDWVCPGNEFYVDASRQAGVYAGLDCVPADSTVTAMEWGSDSPAPLWTYPIRPCRPLDANGWSAGKGVEVSDDGSTIAVVVNMFIAKALQARLLVFDAGSGVPVVEYDLPGASAASAVAITPDGSFIAVYAWPNIYVYDRNALALRWSGSCGAGNDALAISGDGRYLSWGWSTVYLREWTGSTYSQIWTRTKSGYYASECALSIDGNTLAIGWYEYPSFAHTTIEVFEVPLMSLLWSYDYLPPAGLRGGAESGGDAAGDGNLPAARSGGNGDGTRTTDVPSEMVWSTNNELLAIASWGGNFPEIHVFEREDSQPIVIFDTPGTMFDIDIVTTDAGESWVAACGKHVHAGTSGRGGDLYALRIRNWAGVPEEGTAEPVAVRLAAAWPNPTRGETHLAFELAEPGLVRLLIYDAGGRLVRVLHDATAGAGRSEAFWDGRDERGAPVATGVYFARLEVGSVTAHRKIAVLK
jgi:hypothetical protein